jgi:predicted transposase YbfD/YdcC
VHRHHRPHGPSAGDCPEHLGSGGDCALALKGNEQKDQRKKLNTVGLVQSIREIDGHTSSEYRCSIASTGNDARRLATAVRGHWAASRNSSCVPQPSPQTRRSERGASIRLLA